MILFVIFSIAVAIVAYVLGFYDGQREALDKINQTK
jgi:hypothetical protein